jgi:multiple antibiotic resistance protein
LIAGAGTMTSLLSLRAEYEVENIIVAIVLNLILVYVVLKSSKKIEEVVGKTGLWSSEKSSESFLWQSP